MAKRSIARFSWLLVVAVCVATRVGAATINVVIDTSDPSLTGTDVDLVFDLTSSTSNTVTIDPFTSDIPQFGAVSTLGDASGALPGVVTVGGTPGFNELLQTVTLGTTIAFTFTTTDMPVSSNDNFADEFAFFMLVGGAPIDNGGPGGALVTYEFGVENPVLSFFSSDTLPVREGTIPGVAEPGTIALTLVALLALGTMLPVAQIRSRK